MNLAEQLERDLHKRVPLIETKMSRPRNPDGEWTIDATLGKKWIVIQWRKALGFGVSTTEGEVGYGEGPEKVYATLEEALEHIVKLFELTNTA